jgi:electron transfer flavoprotein beta subunit
VSRHLEEGEEILESRLPVQLTVVKELNEISRASLPGMIHAARYQVEIWDKNVLPTEPQYLGLAGSPTKVSKVFPPPQRSGGELLEGDADVIVQQLIGKLSEKKIFQKLQLV